MTDMEIEERIDIVVGSVAVDGMYLTKDEIENLRSVAKGELTHKQVIDKLKLKYSKKTEIVAV